MAGLPTRSGFILVENSRVENSRVESSRLCSAMNARIALASVFAVLVLSPQRGWAASKDYVWDLPRGFPQPRVPVANPMSQAKALLGRYLFYDQRHRILRFVPSAGTSLYRR